MQKNKSKPYKIAIIGGGPNCVYALDRIAALYCGRQDLGKLHIHVFDMHGRFGCGEVHSIDQPKTSLLNRMAGQIGFGCDEKTPNANYVLPRKHQIDFMEWSKFKFQETGDNLYAIVENDWPPRFLHGLALRDAFFNYVELLEQGDRAKVYLHEKEVVDIQRTGRNYSVISGADEKEQVRNVNDVLFATGNQIPQRKKTIQSAGLSHLDCPDECLITSIYPLEDYFSQQLLDRDQSIGVQGTGVSAIDVLLYLTEGRGGRFEESPETKTLNYYPSGQEPKKIFVYGRSGLFCCARPINEKSNLPVGISTEGAFFNRENIENLRNLYGVEHSLNVIGPRKQLDFERHVFPLMLLEMAVLYYGCLLGEASAGLFHDAGMAQAKSFIAGKIASEEGEDIASHLIEPLHEIFYKLLNERLTTDFDAIGRDSNENENWIIYVSRYFAERQSEVVAGHEAKICDSLKFDWDYISNPFSRIKYSNSEEYLEVTLRLMDRDLWEARRGNLGSPVKYAVDTVWRDYRPVLTACVDLGGLNPDSQNLVMTKYFTIHNRIADGPDLMVIRKLRSLIAGLVIDINLGPGVKVEYDKKMRKIRAKSQLGTHEEFFDVMCLAYLERFDVKRDSKPLLENLLGNGMITPWKNSSESDSGEGGGIALNQQLNPITRDGEVLDNAAFIGPPLEGMRFFHHTLCRPDTVQPTIKNLVGWGNRLEKRIVDFYNLD